MARNNDTDTTGKIDLNSSNTAEITDIQRFANELAAADGYTGVGDATSKTYTDHTAVADGDTRKAAISKLSAALNPSGTPLAVTQITSTGDGISSKGNVSLINGTNITVTGNSGAKSYTFDWTGKPVTYFQNQTIPDNTSSATVLAAAAVSLNQGFELDISIKRGTSWLSGKILVTMDQGSTTATISPNYVESGDCGITWSATVETVASVSSICLKYVTTSTGTAAKATYEQRNYPIPS